MRPVFLALGSNLGDRHGHLQAALEGLRRRGVRPRATSPVYATAPVGGPPQADFLNAVVEAETERGPRGVLEAALATEADRGRRRSRGGRWGPRSLDIDLLLYGDRVIDERGLQVPHPRLRSRRFVLVPLHDLCPDRLHPLERRTVRDLLDRCPDGSAVVRSGPPLL